MTLIAELKRRNVFKVGVAYLALAWVVVQATGAIVPALNLPATLVPTVVWIGIIGFPCTIIFSWVYELTPEGLRRESEVDRSQSITHVTSKRLDTLIIALLVVAIGLFVLDRIFPSDASPVGAGPARDTDAVGSPVGAGPARDSAEDSRGQGPLPQEEASTPAPDEKSIAVLPFVNMSEDPGNAYFSEGMSEELLNLLAQAPELKVIARTSSFAFKGKDVPIAEIARQLNVAHVLEGSVRKSGNTVRITAQLVRTADSVHLWSDTYDRPLDDIFKVQDEIANAIVQALQIKLAGGELSRRKGGTQNLEAYQWLLRAWDESQLTQSSVQVAEGYAEQAVKLDPEFGRAWATLAQLASDGVENGWIDAAAGMERARRLAQHTLQVSPDFAWPHTTLQNIHLVFDWDWAAAEAEGRRALAIEHGNSVALMYAGRLSSTIGRWDDGERQLRAAMERSPLWSLTPFLLSMSYYRAGQFVESESMYRKVLELEPQFPWGRPYLAKALLAQGKVEEALAIVQQEADERMRLLVLPVLLQAGGRQSEADEALQAQIAHWADTGAYYVAHTYAYRGDHDRALEWLERAYRQKDAALIEILGEPLFKNIANDPGFIDFLKKMNLPTEPVPVNWQ